MPAPHKKKREGDWLISFPQLHRRTNSIRALDEFGAEVRRLGLVHAEGLLVEIVAGGGKGAGAASHADVAELAAATLPFQILGIAQFIEDGGVVPNVGE